MNDQETTSKKQRLLLAALAEFAEYGISGARMDRLAKRAGVSAGLVYTYFTNKDGLFDAVYDAIVAQTVEAVPITADDLGAYAGRLYDGLKAESPDLAAGFGVGDLEQVWQAMSALRERMLMRSS